MPDAQGRAPLQARRRGDYNHAISRMETMIAIGDLLKHAVGPAVPERETAGDAIARIQGELRGRLVPGLVHGPDLVARYTTLFTGGRG